MRTGSHHRGTRADDGRAGKDAVAVEHEGDGVVAGKELSKLLPAEGIAHHPEAVTRDRDDLDRDPRQRVAIAIGDGAGQRPDRLRVRGGRNGQSETGE